ncbi:MAG: sarcosine oxidase subunit gamma family protein [Roseibium sp.]|nr:sarcosine oxidase subunit gamma family protein [Roseibium sp.]
MADFQTDELFGPDASAAPLLNLDAVSVLACAPLARLSLRCRETGVAPAGTAFGLSLPIEPLASETAPNRAAFWLGPDEWMLVAPESHLDQVMDACETALADQPHALVDISHRQDAIIVSGAKAAWLLNTGVPIDLHADAFPLGTITRTVFHKVPIMIWRTGPDSFVIEAWGSFMEYVTGLLVQAADELKAA